MFKFLFKKEHNVERLIYAYLDNIKLSQESFGNALQECFLHGEKCENFEFFLRQTHKYESKADDVRQEINDLMYGKALIPDSRGDIMGLLAALDVIPHLFENILYMIQTQHIELSEILCVDLKALVGLRLETCDLLYRQTEALFKKSDHIRELFNTIDTLKGLIHLNLNQAVIASVSAAVTVTVMTFLGKPVSTSQAVVGAILGIGLTKGVNTVSKKTLQQICLAWFLTPVVSCFLALAIFFATHLKYIPPQ